MIVRVRNAVASINDEEVLINCGGYVRHKSRTLYWDSGQYFELP